jgi:hypothetical protein
MTQSHVIIHRYFLETNLILIAQCSQLNVERVGIGIGIIQGLFVAFTLGHDAVQVGTIPEKPVFFYREDSSHAHVPVNCPLNKCIVR